MIASFLFLAISVFSRHPIRSLRIARLCLRIVNQLENSKDFAQSDLARIHEHVEGFMDFYQREPSSQEIQRIVETLVME